MTSEKKLWDGLVIHTLRKAETDITELMEAREKEEIDITGVQWRVTSSG